MICHITKNISNGEYIFYTTFTRISLHKNCFDNEEKLYWHLEKLVYRLTKKVNVKNLNNLWVAETTTKWNAPSLFFLPSCTQLNTLGYLLFVWMWCVRGMSLQVCLKGLVALCFSYWLVVPSGGKQSSVCVRACYLWTKLLVRLVVGPRSSFLLGVLQQTKSLISMMWHHIDWDEEWTYPVRRWPAAEKKGVI